MSFFLIFFFFWFFLLLFLNLDGCENEEEEPRQLPRTMASLTNAMVSRIMGEVTRRDVGDKEERDNDEKRTQLLRPLYQKVSSS